MHWRLCGRFEVSSVLCGHGGELPEVVTEDAQGDALFAMFVAFGPQGAAEIGGLE